MIEGISYLIRDFDEYDGKVFALSEAGDMHRFEESDMKWSTVIAGPGVKRALSLEILDNLIFISTDSSGIFITTLDGEEWTLIDSAFSGNVIYSVAVNEDYIFTGMSSMLLYKLRGEDEKTVSVVQQRPLSQLPGFTLRQTGSSSDMHIHFSLPASQFVSVKVFDISGRQMASLANAPFQAGQHTLNWNTRDVATGNYVIQMNTEDGKWAKRFSVFR